MQVNPKIPESWKKILEDEFDKSYFFKLKSFLEQERKKYNIYPPMKDIFSAYNSMKFEDVKVVILGQDPYHGINQAHGLAFSVKEGITLPPSLKNIFQELVNDIGCGYPKDGNLQKWANQGVLLLNVVLTVRAAEANTHKGKGWEYFTDATIKAISENLDNVVFILWGRPAQMKEKLIDTSRHLVLKAPHPSPLSAYRGFFGSKPFTKTNNYLIAHAKSPIDWCLN
jgi:uracil-DNA glycosylase